ncbi:hypothetical protein PB01_04400 [Psychrobacillus glaciei]|uniref:DUF885 domain-containing protein n=1 Tax=Psychrobacillus glaciei TaxID=2283160 RepID=A0A5J6SK85_9BACI|nr:hypothetical protein [Psychrobacillus glaciei]QFF98119.1 hypothetical protein PB01_04400 [Psychrobacillus glaciei]
MKLWTEQETGEKIVDITLSLNEQAMHLFETEVTTASYSDVKATLKTFDEIGSAIEEVEKAVRTLEGHPGEYLRGMMNGFNYFARSMQGDKIPYDELILNIQQLPSTLISDEQLEHAKELVEESLTNIGYSGSLAEKVSAWKSDTIIAPEEVVNVAENFRELSKKGTLNRVIELPKEDGVDWIKPIRGVFWSGYSKYTGDYRGNLTFNIDRPWTEPILAQIMTHEAYPGHQAFYCRWDYEFKNGNLPLEASYYMINSPTNALFEGGPETALSFLGWDDVEEETEGISDEKKMQYRAARHFLDYQRMYMTNACYLYNLHAMTKEEVIRYMINEGGITEIEANNCFRFFSHPVQKTYYPSYYYGRWMIGNAYAQTPKNLRNEYFKILYDTPHTTETFVKAITQLHDKEFDAFNTFIKI